MSVADKMKYSKSAYAAISGMTAALSVVIMIGSLFPSLSYAIPMVAGGMLIVPVAEFGAKKSIPIYASVFFLSLMLPMVAKDAALMYLFLFGLYPLLQFSFEKIKPKVVRILAKLLYFNVAAILAVWLSWVIFSLPFLEDGEGMWIIIVMLVIGGAVFLLYDLALYKFAYLYDVKYADRFHRLFKIR